MDRSRVCIKGTTRVATAALALAGSVLAAAPPAEVTNSRLIAPLERLAVARAIRGAAGRLGHAECEGLLDEFADASGRPLRATLDAAGIDVTTHLNRVLFVDGRPSECRGRTLVYTTVGSRVVFVCGRRFEHAMNESALHAEASIIHEMLHTLGLGENPPTSYHITSRILARCGQVASPPGQFR